LSYCDVVDTADGDDGRLVIGKDIPDTIAPHHDKQVVGIETARADEWLDRNRWREREVAKGTRDSEAVADVGRVKAHGGSAHSLLGDEAAHLDNAVDLVAKAGLVVDREAHGLDLLGVLGEWVAVVIGLLLVELGPAREDCARVARVATINMRVGNNHDHARASHDGIGALRVVQVLAQLEVDLQERCF